MDIGRYGVWTFSDDLGPAEATDFVRRIEALGYGAMWIPEALGLDPFVRAAYLLERCERLVLATGIANIYARDPMATKAAQHTLCVHFDGRFLLGLGVSHAPFVEDVRGHTYRKPIETMRTYLDAMQNATYAGPEPPEEPPIVLGALRPRMLTLAAEQTRGAHPYLTTAEHTRRARELMGDEAWLCPEVKVLLERDPEKARRLGREACSVNLSLPNYQKTLLWLGYTEADLEGGGSDRLIDDLVAWGDEAALQARLEAHLDAGASHVCVHTVNPDGSRAPHLPVLEALAPAHRG
ncbi:MAG: TIGR03620 family F420-dependent LLM class oxidoreductase [Deltaproteobacteria bacterium]|jgi:probable F420-dependent oxidoreductase|nr:TIGR03620 family F420-dependent LLM class oxidoreductase [Deltaproteobacteria bacterium]